MRSFTKLRQLAIALHLPTPSRSAGTTLGGVDARRKLPTKCRPDSGGVTALSSVLCWHPVPSMSGSDIQCLSQYESVFRSDAVAGRVAFVSGGGTGINFRIGSSHDSVATIQFRIIRSSLHCLQSATSPIRI
jgi:hypothetical protein